MIPPFQQQNPAAVSALVRSCFVKVHLADLFHVYTAGRNERNNPYTVLLFGNLTLVSALAEDFE
jgi:hypothetical protein